MDAPSDQQARDRAAREFDRNLVVVAGAGSGKTTILVERLLNLCLGRGVPLRQVRALTFTEKAAAEMRDRLATQLSALATALREAGGDAAAALVPLQAGGTALRPARRSLEWVAGGMGLALPLVRERVLAALEDLDAGGLGTLHAACADLVRRHPRQARLDPAFDVDDGLRTEQLFDEEWALFLRDELGVDAARAGLWQRVLERVDLSELRDVAWDAARRGLRALPEGGGEAARSALVGSVTRLVERCRQALADTCSPDYRKRMELGLRLLDTFLARGPQALREAWEAEDDHDLVLKGPLKGSTKAADPDACTQAFADLARTVKALVAVDEALCEDVLACVAPVLSRVGERCDREGVVAFDRLLVAARDLLRDHPDVRRAEGSDLKALLIDEVQDTDPLQYEIAFLLAEDEAGPPASDPWSARLAPGRLFLVGDPKQSIYRFRGADIGAFDRAVRQVVAQGGEVLSLSANFRSRAEVLVAVNHLCGAVIREEPPYQPAYQHVEPCRDVAPAGASLVHVWTVAHGGSDATSARLAESRVLASRIAAWRAEGAIGSHGEVTVLLRAMTDVALYQRGFVEAGVPFVTQGGKNFVERDEVVQAVTLLKCLVSPHDAAALLAVLRSPCCGADDVELARFAALVKATPGLSWSWRSHGVLDRLDAAARASVPHVSRTLAGLAALAQRACRLPADEALRLVLSDPARTPELPWHPRLLEIHAASHEGVQRIANLEKLVARATELSRRDGLTLPRVVEELERELSGQAQGESPLADEKVDAVRLMTIHQAKGLEFPIVVLPDLARPERAAHGRGVRWGAGMVGLSLKAGRNLAALVLEAEARRHEEAELRRLLYVAMTRAQDRLVLLHGRRARGRSWLLDALFEHWAYDPDGEGGPLLDGAVIHEVVAVPEEAAAGVEREPLAAIAEAVLAGDAARARLAAMREPALASVTGSRELLHESRLSREAHPADAGVEVGGGEAGSPLVAAPDPSPDADAAGAGVPARAAGIAVHLALEQWDLKDAVSLRELAGRAALLAAAETGDDREEVERHVRALLDAMPGSSALATLSRGRVLARELPFLMERDGLPWQGFIDLVLELDGRPWVVDWKTDRELVPERHRAQLELYAEAVRRWRGVAQRPGMALVHVATGRWVPLAEPG